MIILDAGHGGFDPGGGSNIYFKEKDLTKKITDYQFNRLNQLGLPVQLVRKGDETLNPIMYDKVKGADYVMHEAFCLDSEENIFHAYEKNHSTAKSASEVMNKLDVKNLILYHTEESHGTERKKLYTKEGQDNFNGNIIVPDDLETINVR